MDQTLEKIFQKNIQLLKDTDRLIHYFRIQNFDYALRITVEIINQLSTHIELLLEKQEYFNNRTQIMDQQLVLGMFGDLLEAQENKDYILLADLYELSLLPFLMKLQEEIISREVYNFDELNYNEIIRTIGQADSELAKAITALPSTESLLNDGYAIEYTAGGLMTLAAMDNGKKFYFHTNGRVQKEAFTLANSWYREEAGEYVIYGLGLGYHIAELLALDSYITIEIYESDINVIHLACAFSSVMKSLINHPNIKLIYDPKFIKLPERIKNLKYNEEFFIHYPSLRNIKNKVMKERLENYFIQYSSIINQSHLLNGNFKENLKYFDAVADVLKEQFEGKDLYIVAAGPSLDQNFMQLKEVHDKGIILATGTVFRKLINAGIVPDFVIVTDANPRVYAQVSGLEETKVPMILLSTAFQGFAKHYQNKKYILFQKEFIQAEEYAGAKGYHLYRTGGSVSTTALDMGIYFKCKRIIFLGLDLAFTDNFVHAAGTSRRDLTGTDDLRQVEDIHGNLIYTSRSLDMYRQWIEKRIKEVQGIEFIDASEGGAKISGMRLAALRDVLLD